jgi:hypothetical protein
MMPVFWFQGDVISVGTNFKEWDEAEIKAFLDQRGEDYDDCTDRAALVCACCCSACDPLDYLQS